jgi:hypothetical protein
LNNPNIFRCLNCNLIPQILINEYNQEAEVICDNAYHDKTHHNITNYKDFRLNSLNHSINDNIFCNFCNKSLNQLSSNNMIYYCPLCELFFCSDDELIHKKQKHQNNAEIKNSYKSIYNKNNTENKDILTRRRSSISKKISNNTENNSGRRFSFRNSISRELLDNKKILEVKELLCQDDKEKDIKNLYSNLKKIPIYLMDTYCYIHDEIFNSYCHDCHKNICVICKNNEHKNHYIENFSEILLNEEELNKKKLELNIVKDNLSKINDYFSALIEAIKCRFEKLYKYKY